VLNLTAAANGFRLLGVSLAVATMPTYLDLLKGAQRSRENLLVRACSGKVSYHIITAHQGTQQVPF
jgi:hypothetical protein